jgi:hypothetical protein
LSIDSVTAKHAGEYTCKVLNEAGYSAITTTLVVKGWFTIKFRSCIFIFIPYHSLLNVELFNCFCLNSLLSSSSKVGTISRKRTVVFQRLLPDLLLGSTR